MAVSMEVEATLRCGSFIASSLSLTSGLRSTEKHAVFQDISMDIWIPTYKNNTNNLPGPLIILGSLVFNILPICRAINVLPVPEIHQNVIFT